MVMVTGALWADSPLTAVTTLWAWASVVSWKVSEPCWLMTVCKLALVTSRTVTVRVTLPVPLSLSVALRHDPVDGVRFSPGSAPDAAGILGSTRLGPDSINRIMYEGDGVGAGRGEEVADADAAAVAGGLRDGLDRRTVAPVDAVGEPGGRIDGGRVSGGDGVGEDLCGQSGVVPAKRWRRIHVGH